jgi:hypothetical protein
MEEEVIKQIRMFGNDVIEFQLNALYSRSNINVNDVLGDYSLTLVDSLDTLAVGTNRSVSSLTNE